MQAHLINLSFFNVLGKRNETDQTEQGRKQSWNFLGQENNTSAPNPPMCIVVPKTKSCIHGNIIPCPSNQDYRPQHLLMGRH